MNIHRAVYCGILFLLAAFFNSGCASHPQTMLNSWADPAFAPTVASPVALNAPVGGKPEDAAFGEMLRSELKNESFHLVPADQANYLLSYVVSDNMLAYEVKTMHYASVQSAPPQSTGEALDSRYMPASRGYLQTDTYETPTRDVRLFLYTNPKVLPGSLRLAWQGTITIEQNATPERQTALIRKLLENFGKNFNGPVTIAAQTGN